MCGVPDFGYELVRANVPPPNRLLRFGGGSGAVGAAGGKGMGEEWFFSALVISTWSLGNA